MKTLIEFWNCWIGKHLVVLVLPLFIIISEQVCAQDSLIITTDTSQSVDLKSKDKKLSRRDQLSYEDHSSSRATLYSAVLPGLGQIYNRQAWKTPIIYVGFGLLGYNFVINQDGYKEFSTILSNRANGDSTDIYIKTHTNDRIATIKNAYRNNRDLCVIGFGIVYTMNILDAYVNAELLEFDISDDLSMKVQPFMYYNANYQPITGISLSFRL